MSSPDGTGGPSAAGATGRAVLGGDAQEVALWKGPGVIGARINLHGSLFRKHVLLQHSLLGGNNCFLQEAE